MAVIASSERQMFRIKFADDSLMSYFIEFLSRRLSFDTISTTLNVDDVNNFEFDWKLITISNFKLIFSEFTDFFFH